MTNFPLMLTHGKLTSLVSDTLPDLFFFNCSGSDVSETLLVFLTGCLEVVSRIRLLMSKLEEDCCFVELFTLSTNFSIHSVTVAS